MLGKWQEDGGKGEELRYGLGLLYRSWMSKRGIDPVYVPGGGLVGGQSLPSENNSSHVLGSLISGEWSVLRKRPNTEI